MGRIQDFIMSDSAGLEIYPTLPFIERQNQGRGGEVPHSSL